MAKRGGNIVLNSYDDLFETQESKEDAGKEKVDTLVIDDLVPFKHHPFKVLDNEEMNRMVESVQEFGVLNPLIVRPNEESLYQRLLFFRHKSHESVMQYPLHNWYDYLPL